MKRFASIRVRLAMAIMLTALIPSLAALYLARSMVRQSAERFYLPEIGVRLDQSLGLYKELATEVKRGMRAEATAISRSVELVAAANAGDQTRIARALGAELADAHGLAVLSVRDGEGRVLARVDRGRPIDAEREHQLTVVNELGSNRDRSLELVAEFAVEKRRFDELDGMSEFVAAYATMEQRRDADEQTYVLAFAVLLGVTIVAGLVIGSALARGVATRVEDLARATRRVAAGDLDTRVDTVGDDEIAALAVAFNRMVAEVQESRGRIEYLQRIAAWQEMARRLAHEIKNPLTPIMLAVQEIHERYRGEDDAYRVTLDATLEIVEAEVGTLRRLVTEFSDFARLPRAELAPADLNAFIKEQREQATRGESGDAEAGAYLGDRAERVTLEFRLAAAAVPVLADLQMLRRVLVNLVRNAAQAVVDANGGGTVRVSVEAAGGYAWLRVEDDGPGVAPALRETIFDPYVTTKTDGTGLGLAIAKKIVVEHDGVIDVGESELGGASIGLRLPLAASTAQS